MANYETLWATPLLRVLMQPQGLADQLAPFLLGRETEEFRHPNSPQRNHDHVFESTFDLLKLEDDVIQKFRAAFFSHIGGFIQEVNGLTQEEVQKIRFDCHCWYHITRSSGYFQPHNHANASWSAIYCVDPGDDKDDDSSHAGHLFFEDPRPAAGMYQDVANRRMNRDVSFNAIRFRPRKDELIIFPSYLMHAVESYVGEKPRITIAANFWFRQDKS